MTRTDRIRMLGVGVALPAVLSVAGLIAVIVMLPSLPDPLAVHWGVSGAPDGFGPPWIAAIIPAIGLLYSGFALAVARAGGRDEGITFAQRGILATGPFLAFVLAVTGAGSAYVQVGLADAADAPSVVPVLAIGLLGGVVLGVGAWFALPRHVAPGPIDHARAPIQELTPTEKAVWVMRVEPSRAAVTLIVGGLAVGVTGGAAVIWASAPLSNLAVWALILIVVGLAVASTMFWTVRVDADGFSVRSALGAPRFHYPLSDLEGAAVTTIHPTRDFGGWGIRSIGGGRTGIVVRTGEAIEVQRVGGRVLAVTVDDAERGAALLNGLIARAGTGIR
ncbi:MAG: DUF1648 domain-containing protein [Rhodoglobus sp.]|nr:DUF1648 domain-containing protein [Rhodoglobus sp.]